MKRFPILLAAVGAVALLAVSAAYLARPDAGTAEIITDDLTTQGGSGLAATTPTPTPAPPTSGDGIDQMRQHMDQMHGPDTFEAMRQWMEERWGPGAFEAMLENCPHGAEGMTPGQGMMDTGMMGGQGMMSGSGTAPGQGMMGSGGMMGGPQR